MNDSELEENLRQMLHPVRPSIGLRTRIQHELRPQTSQPPAQARQSAAWISPGFWRFLRDFGWASAGAIAALATLAYLPLKQTPMNVGHKATATAAGGAGASSPESETAAASADQPDAFEHAESTNELVSTEDSDEVIETSNGPARQVRYSYLERHAWSNPRTGALVVLEVPREDIYLLPVSLQ